MAARIATALRWMVQSAVLLMLYWSMTIAQARARGTKLARSNSRSAAKSGSFAAARGGKATSDSRYGGAIHDRIADFCDRRVRPAGAGRGQGADIPRRLASIDERVRCVHRRVLVFRVNANCDIWGFVERSGPVSLYGRGNRIYGSVPIYGALEG